MIKDNAYKPIVLGNIDSYGNLTTRFKTPNVELLKNDNQNLTIETYHNELTNTNCLKLSNFQFEWIGSEEISNPNGQHDLFCLIDRGNCYECCLIDSNVKWIPLVDESITEAKALEHELKRKNESKLNIKVGVSKKEINENASNSYNKYDNDNMPDHDTIVKKKLKKKQMVENADKRKTVAASVSMGAVLKTESHWDFKDGDASDDDGDDGNNTEDNENFEVDMFYDDESDKELLTSYGSNIDRLLNFQNKLEYENEVKEYMNDAESGTNNSQTTKKTELLSDDCKNKQKTFSEVGSNSGSLLTQESLKNAMISLLKQHGELPIKEILRQLKVTLMNKKFQVVKNLVSQYCEIMPNPNLQSNEWNPYVRLKNT